MDFTRGLEAVPVLGLCGYINIHSHLLGGNKMNRAEFKNANYIGFVGHVCDILDSTPNHVLIRPLTGKGAGIVMWCPRSDVGPITCKPNPPPKSHLELVMQATREAA